MKNFEKHIKEKLSDSVKDFLTNTPIEEIKRTARNLQFKSICPIAMENDSKELRENMKKTSEMLFKFIRFQKKNKIVS